MENRLNNEKGSLAYVMMIVVVLSILIPSLLFLSSANYLNNTRSESERKATQLAVSGMQSFVSFPDTDKLEKLNYIKNHYYGTTPMTVQLPEGSQINFKQYVVADSVAKSEVLQLNSSDIVPVGSVVQTKYWVVVSATTSDNKYTKTMVQEYDFRDLTATPSINQPYAGDTSISGTAASNSTVKVIVNGVTYTVTAQSDGAYSVAVPALSQGEIVTATATDTAGGKLESLSATATVSAANATATPSINPIPGNGDTVVEGTAVAGATITVTVTGSFSGTYTGVAASDGSYSVSIGTDGPLSAGDIVKVTATLSPLAASLPATATVLGRTDTPIITPLLRDGDTNIQGTTEPLAHIMVYVNQNPNGPTAPTVWYEGDATSAGAFSVIGPLLHVGDIVYVTAKTSSEATSYVASTTVLAASSGTSSTDSGVVLDVQPDGTTVIGFQDVYTTSNQLVVTSGLGSYSTSSNIDLQAADGIVIEPDVSLTTTDNGSSSGLSLASSGGDVVVNNASLTNSGNSSFSTININAAGDVYLQGAVLTAQRSVNITAGGSIYLDNANITVDKTSSTITFTLSAGSTGIISVNGLKISEDASVSIPAGAKVCGTLSNTSTGGLSVNGGAVLKSFTCN